MVEVNDVTTREVRKPNLPEPTRESELFDELMEFKEFSQAPDVAVEGDWTVRTTAAWQAGLQWADGIQRNDMNSLSKNFSGQRVSSVGSPSGLDAAFGSGDTSMTVGINNDYHMSNSFGASSTNLYAGSDRVANAGAGDRHIAFNPPSGKIAQLIGQFEYGIQFQAVAGIIDSIPKLGATESWSIPSFDTAAGHKSFSAVYSFNSGVPRALSTVGATVKYPDTSEKQLNVVLRNNSGKELAKETLTFSGSKSYDFSVVFSGLLSSGLVEFHSPGEAMTISNTSINPPRLG